MSELLKAWVEEFLAGPFAPYIIPKVKSAAEAVIHGLADIAGAVYGGLVEIARAFEELGEWLWHGLRELWSYLDTVASYAAELVKRAWTYLWSIARFAYAHPIDAAAAGVAAGLGYYLFRDALRPGKPLRRRLLEALAAEVSQPLVYGLTKLWLESLARARAARYTFDLSHGLVPVNSFYDRERLRDAVRIAAVWPLVLARSDTWSAVDHMETRLVSALGLAVEDLYRARDYPALVLSAPGSETLFDQERPRDTLAYRLVKPLSFSFADSARASDVEQQQLYTRTSVSGTVTVTTGSTVTETYTVGLSVSAEKQTSG